jgi:hypothetical protein
VSWVFCADAPAASATSAAPNSALSEAEIMRISLMTGYVNRIGREAAIACKAYASSVTARDG